MKKIAIVCGFVAALLCFGAQNASAQYVSPIVRKGADLVDGNGAGLTDSQIVEIVGTDVFTNTVVGARKQVKAGRGLIWGGAGGMAVGAAACITGVVLANNVYDVKGELMKDQGTAIALVGGVVAGLGALAFDMGMPLYYIGRERLNWVAEQATKTVSFNYKIGLTPNGVGFAMNF
jgi:hypothetical protein